MSIKIQQLSIQGDGIAEGPLYVPFTLPDEEVEGEVIGNRIPTPRILTPSEDRVKAPCSHFKTCGGCAMQHASDSFMEDWKRQVVEKALEAQGLSAEIRPTITSPAQSRRRATFGGRRTKKGVMVGFYGRGSDALIAIPSCKLLHADILAATPALEALTLIGASRKSPISLSVTQSSNGPDIAVIDAKEADGKLMAELGRLTEQYKLSRLTWNGEIVAMRAAPLQQFGEMVVSPPPGAFLQATQSGQEALILAVREAAGNAKNIIDLFSGCGTFSLPLAQNAKVLAIENDEAMLAALDAGWRKATGMRSVETRKRDLFRDPLMAEDMGKHDAVVIDPPRAGAQSQCAELAQSSISRIAFVSCNPVTFARDALILTKGGYTLEWIQPIDQFRWSPHVELVALFLKG